MTAHTINATWATRHGYRPQTWTAGELAEALGDKFTVFVSFGHVGGVEKFARTDMRRNGDRMEVMAGIADAHPGTVVMRHAMDRKLRILVK